MRNTGIRANWVRYLLALLLVEKLVQHIVVTLALIFDWSGIRSTVAVAPVVLTVLGAVVAVLFAVSVWGLLTRQKRIVALIVALALFDIIGEFFAQGTIVIKMNVSFLVAVVLLILSAIYRRDELGKR